MSKTYSAGIVTAYGAAKRAGYQGTYEDFCRQQAGYAESAAAVEQAKNTAVNAASTATAKATEATTAATDARAQAQSAEASATTASTKASEASQSATTATTKASEASASATSAEASAANAEASALDSEQSAQSVSGSLAQIQTNKEDIGKLKADLGAVKTVTITAKTETITENIFPSLTWTAGYIGADGVAHGDGTSTTYRYSQKYPVSEGDVLAFANANFSFSFIAAYLNDVVQSDKGQQGGKSYTVPSGVDSVIISEFVSRGDAAINLTHQQTYYVNALGARMAAAEGNIEDLQGTFDTVSYTDNVAVDTTPTFTAGAIDQNGTTYGSSVYLVYQYSQAIAATNGATVEAFDANGNNRKMRWVCAYKNGAAVSASGTNADVYRLTLSGDVDSVVVTCLIESAVTTIRVTTPAEKTAHFATAKKIPLGYMSESGSLADGEGLYLPRMNVKNGNVLIFNANITEFSSVKVGKQNNTYVIVDDTNITLQNTGGTYTIPHGLTIGSNITVMVQTEASLDASLIRVSSDGVTFDYTTPARRFMMDEGQPYAISVGSTLTECRFSWTSKYINKPIWIFGDSYLSWYDTRWTYYLAEDGYAVNCMLNGFAGQASESAYKSLVNLLALTTPKMIVWCLGMNDEDGDSAVSESWNTYYLKIVELSKKLGFELVLYTVPTTPIMENSFKNAIIRASGYRYIEADKAVRINDDSDWVTGALDSDEVHPTAIGAKILYCRILADLPEIMCN